MNTEKEVEAMGLAIVETIVADARIEGNEQLHLVLENGAKLDCTAVAGTAPRRPSFCIDEESWTDEMREALNALAPDMGRQPKSRFVQVVGKLEMGEPLHISACVTFRSDSVIYRQQLTLAPIETMGI